MADDDEVDVLGDFNLENLLTKDENRLNSCYDGGVGSELLHSDYNSTWYMDGGSPPWYDRNQIDSFSSLPFSLNLSSSPGPSQWGESSSTTPANGSTGSNWTEKERNLLKEGLELFGRSWPRLAQFVGTKTSHQIKNYVKMTKFDSESERVPIVGDATNLQFSNGDGSTDIAPIPYTELIDDMQIPASMEEVIAVVSTAQPTVPASSGSNRGDHSSSHRKRKAQTYVHNAVEPCSLQAQEKSIFQSAKIIKSTSKRGRRPRSVPQKVTTIPRKRGRGRPRKNSDKSDAFSVPKARSVQHVPTYPELDGEVVRIRREGSPGSEDSDLEIDIEDDFEDDENLIQDSKNFSPDEPKAEGRPVKQERQNNGTQKEKCVVKKEEAQLEEPKTSDENGFKEGLKASASHQEILDAIHDMPSPTFERYLERDKISDEEMTVHADFFEGRPAKNEIRYLKIRNHIIDMWKQNRPNYVTKTSVRTGLRNCGDVNCIGRIHAYLEQIGAINFGCEQTRYLKPLEPLAPPGKPQSLNNKEKQSRELLCMEGMRPRKKKFDHIEENLLASAEGGYTIKHTEDGKTELTYNTVVKAKPSRSDNTPVKLLRCAKFSEDNPAPYNVNLSLEALLVVDMHAHCSRETEIMGLLGGLLKMGTLHIQAAVPCRASYSSNTHCDMCPVSQSEAVQTISQEGMQVVGWYHSHPTFLPNPSQQDLFTQTSMQRWLTEKSGAPFVGLILSPYGPNITNLASIYRVIIVDAESDTPFRFPVEVVYQNSDPKHCLEMVSKSCSLMEQPSLDGQFSGQDPSLPSISLQNKFLESALHHIRSCNPSLSNDLQRSILKGLHEVSSLFK